MALFEFRVDLPNDYDQVWLQILPRIKKQIDWILAPITRQRMRLARTAHARVGLPVSYNHVT